MKRILTFVALFAGLSIAVSAQENVQRERKHRGKMTQESRVNRTPEEIAKVRTERLDKDLKFTDSQRKEVYAFHLEQAKLFKEREAVKRAEQRDMRQEMKASRDKFNSMLTPEQQKVMADKYAERTERFKGRRLKDKHDGERPLRKKMDKKITVDSSNS